MTPPKFTNPGESCPNLLLSLLAQPPAGDTLTSPDDLKTIGRADTSRRTRSASLGGRARPTPTGAPRVFGRTRSTQWVHRVCVQGKGVLRPTPSGAPRVFGRTLRIGSFGTRIGSRGAPLWARAIASSRFGRKGSGVISSRIKLHLYELLGSQHNLKMI